MTVKLLKVGMKTETLLFSEWVSVFFFESKN